MRRVIKIWILAVVKLSKRRRADRGTEGRREGRGRDSFVRQVAESERAVGMIMGNVGFSFSSSGAFPSYGKKPYIKQPHREIINQRRGDVTKNVVRHDRERRKIISEGRNYFYALL